MQLIEIQCAISSIFGVQLNVRNERKRVFRMWENAYLSIENPKTSMAFKWAVALAANCLLCLCDSTSLCQQLSASEAAPTSW